MIDDDVEQFCEKFELMNLIDSFEDPLHNPTSRRTERKLHRRINKLKDVETDTFKPANTARFWTGRV